MPKRRKRRRTNISDAETSAVPVQEAAEVPPVEPEVACQPVLPTRVHSSLSSSKWPSIGASMRKLARFRYAFAKRELYWNRRRMVENRTLDAFRIGASVQKAVASGMRLNGWSLGSLHSSTSIA